MENTNTNTKNCRLCKKDVTIDLFEKNGKILKTCDTCRSIVRESKRLKREKNNSESENSENEQQPVEQPVVEQPVVEQPVVEQPVVEQPVVEQSQVPIPETPANSIDDNISDSELVEEDIEANLKQKQKESEPKKKATPVKVEKNLPSTKRPRKTRAKKVNNPVQ